MNFEIFKIKRLNKRVNIKLRAIYTIVKKDYQKITKFDLNRFMNSISRSYFKKLKNFDLKKSFII